MREETCCRHMGYSFRLTARVVLNAPSHIRNNTYHGLCCTNRGTLAGMRNNSLGPPSLLYQTSSTGCNETYNNGSTMEDRSDDLLHHEWTLHHGATYRSMVMRNITLVSHTRWIPKEMEGNVLFNDALNTFYLRLYGIRHMAKDHSDSERGNLLPPHGLLFPISSKGSFT